MSPSNGKNQSTARTVKNLKTQLLHPGQIELAAALLRRGECVAFPTETVYGLGANAWDEKAVAKIFAAKGRPADNPLIVHCHHQDQLFDLAREWPPEAEVLMDEFWPGPLTLVLKKKPAVPEIVTGGLDTVALRFPDHPVALELLRAAALPVAAPSANISGRPSPTRAEHVLADLGGKIAAVLDGGPAPGGLESTVLDCSSLPFRILRPGSVTREMLGDFAPLDIDPEESAQLPSKFRHYTPAASVVLVTGNDREGEIQRQIAACREKGLKAAVMAFQDSPYAGVPLLDLGNRSDLREAAARLYLLLRQADEQGYNLVLIEGLAETGLARTLMNRLRQAASQVVQT